MLRQVLWRFYMTKFVTKETYGAYLEAFDIRQPRQAPRRYAYPARHDDLAPADEQLELVPLMDRSGKEGVVIAVVDELVYASRFSVGARNVDASGRTKPAICDLCKTQQDAGGVRLVSFPRTKTASEHDSNGHLCCADLACSLHVRDLTPEALTSRTVLRETEFIEGIQRPLSLESRVARLKNNLGMLFTHLEIDPQLVDLSSSTR
jgi:hypothetical protein